MKGSVGEGGWGAKSCVTELDTNFRPTPGQIHLGATERGGEVQRRKFGKIFTEDVSRSCVRKS